jgi:hypothetical protein
MEAAARQEQPTLKLLEGYLTKQQLCEELDITLRTERKKRQLGEAPPYVVLCGEVLYPVDRFRKWLSDRIVVPVRSGCATQRMR